MSALWSAHQVQHVQRQPLHELARMNFSQGEAKVADAFFQASFCKRTVARIAIKHSLDEITFQKCLEVHPRHRLQKDRLYICISSPNTAALCLTTDFNAILSAVDQTFLFHSGIPFTIWRSLVQRAEISSFVAAWHTFNSPFSLWERHRTHGYDVLALVLRNRCNGTCIPMFAQGCLRLVHSYCADGETTDFILIIVFVILICRRRLERFKEVALVTVFTSI